MNLVSSELKKAGVALFLGVAQFSVFLIIAESTFPNYSVSGNYISDLGRICGRPPANPNSCIAVQPSSMIFNGSIIFLGILVIIGSYFLLKAKVPKDIPILAIISAIGMIGVGTFPEGSPFMLHTVSSFITFLFIGIFAIVSYRIQKFPMNVFAIIAGAATLLALFLYASNIYLGLGMGGMERMVVYPVMVWSLAFAGYLMNSK
ncbi:MAG: DUF998 domain-containing protein [Thermoproteota archaeon]|jgi:Predicted membrane protein